jgi:acetyl-CoA carboxylase/biotin carboxylase 1
MLDPRCSSGAGATSSRIFLHQLAEVSGVTPGDVVKAFKHSMAELTAKYATRLLRLKVDEVEVKVRVASGTGQGEVQAVRLVASSMGGRWLDRSAFLEYPDPLTDVTVQVCPINDEGVNVGGVCFLDPYPSSSKLALKRTAARRIGSTYAYDFLGLLEVGSDCWDIAGALEALPELMRVACLLVACLHPHTTTTTTAIGGPAGAVG